MEGCVYDRLDHGGGGYWIVSVPNRRVLSIADWCDDVSGTTHYKPITYIGLEKTFREATQADITWATRALELADKPTHSELVSVVNGISKLIADRKLAILSATLQGLLKDPALRLEVMIAALRGSFPARSQIAQWGELIRVARQRVASVGRNPDSLLRGLS